MFTGNILRLTVKVIYFDCGFWYYLPTVDNAMCWHSGKSRVRSLCKLLCVELQLVKYKLC